MKRIIFTPAVFALLFILSGCKSLGKEETFKGVELYHTESITDMQANSLGDYLVSSGFADGSEKTVQLTKLGDTYHFRMVVKEGSDSDAGLNKTFKFFASELSSRVFDGAPVVVEMCSNLMTTLKSFESEDLGKVKNINGVQLYHTNDITDAEVDSLGNYLISSKFANGDAKSVQITKSGNTYQFRMVVKKGIDKDPVYLKNARLFATLLSKNVFANSPVELDMCDDYLNTVVALLMDDGVKTM